MLEGREKRYTGDPQSLEMTPIPVQRKNWPKQTLGDRLLEFSKRNLSSENPKEILWRRQFHVDMGITFRFFLKSSPGKLVKKIAAMQFWTWMKQETTGRGNRDFLCSEKWLPKLRIRMCCVPSYVTFMVFFFFFLKGEQHELSKSADGSKFFWVVKCQTDGNT